MLSGYGPVLRLAAPVHPCAWGRFVGVGVALRCRGSSSCRRRRVIRHDITVSDIAIDRHVHDARRGPVGRAFVQARLPGRAVRGATCERGARCRWARNHVGPPTRPRPARGLAGASPDAVRLRVVASVGQPPPLDAKDTVPPQTVRQAKIRASRRATRHDTSLRNYLAIPVRVPLSRPLSPGCRPVAESADPACLACGGIAPKRTLWPLWTAGRSLTVIHTSPRASIVSSGTRIRANIVTSPGPILVNERLRSLGRFQTCRPGWGAGVTHINTLNEGTPLTDCRGDRCGVTNRTAHTVTERHNAANAPCLANAPAARSHT